MNQICKGHEKNRVGGAILDTSRYNQYFQLKYFVLNKCYICFEHMIKICTQISIYRFFRYIHPIFFKFSKKYFKRGKFGHGGQFWTPLNMQKSLKIIIRNRSSKSVIVQTMIFFHIYTIFFEKIEVSNNCPSNFFKKIYKIFKKIWI